MANLTAEMCSVWNVSMKTYLVMISIMKLKDIGNCNIQNCFVHPNSFTVSTEILNIHLWSDDSLNETEN